MEGCGSLLGLASQRVVSICGASASAHGRRTSISPGTCNRVLGFRLFGVDPFHPYIAGRGISLATARLLDRLLLRAGIFVAKSGDSDSQSGRRLDCLRRQVGGRSTPKVQAPSCISKEQRTLQLPPRCPRAVSPRRSCRGILRLHESSPGRISSRGCVDGVQPIRPTGGFARPPLVEAVLLLDGDQAGQHAMSKITASLSGTMKVHCGHIPSGGQPDELSPDELRNAIEDAI